MSGAVVESSVDLSFLDGVARAKVKSCLKQSFSVAKMLAFKKCIFSMLDAKVDQTHVVHVLGVTKHHVVLSLGRSAMIICQSDLNKGLVVDDVVKIEFKGGKGNVLAALDSSVIY